VDNRLEAIDKLNLFEAFATSAIALNQPVNRAMGADPVLA